MALNYSIKAVSIETGLSAHTIRAWERRYGVLEPERTATNRRSYSEADVERLHLLSRAVRFGHSIGRVAQLTNDQLKELGLGDRKPIAGASSASASDFLESAKMAILDLDAARLEDALVRGGATLGLGVVIDEILVPVLAFLDAGWDSGQVSIAMEHLASATIRAFLDSARLTLDAPSSAPLVAVTTPKGQHHELGALIVALLAALAGCRVAYLGPNLPAPEIAVAASKLGAAAVAISIVHPLDDPNLASEIVQIQKLSPNHVQLWVGGRAAARYSNAIEKAKGRHIGDLIELRAVLRKLA